MKKMEEVKRQKQEEQKRLEHSAQKLVLLLLLLLSSFVGDLSPLVCSSRKRDERLRRVVETRMKGIEKKKTQLEEKNDKVCNINGCCVLYYTCMTL